MTPIEDGLRSFAEATLPKGADAYRRQMLRIQFLSGAFFMFRHLAQMMERTKLDPEAHAAELRAIGAELDAFYKELEALAEGTSKP